MTSKEYLTDHLECKAITAALTINNQFAYSKTGFIRFVRDWNKRSYFLEIVKEKNNKMALMINLNNDIKKVKFNTSRIIMNTIHGVIHLELANQSNNEVFKENYEFCDKDRDLEGDMKIDLNKKPKEPKLNKISIKKELGIIH